MTSAIPAWLDASPWRDLIERADRPAVARALLAEEPGIREFAALLSPAAGGVLEALAQRAQALTRRHFGRTIALYAPLYLSNYCCSGCAYCGFASNRKTSRHKLTPDELEAELTALKDMGLEEVLLLTGERNAVADYEYVRDCVERRRHASITSPWKSFPCPRRSTAGWPPPVAPGSRFTRKPTIPANTSGFTTGDPSAITPRVWTPPRGLWQAAYEWPDWARCWG